MHRVYVLVVGFLVDTVVDDEDFDDDDEDDDAVDVGFDGFMVVIKRSFLTFVFVEVEF
jgi:hypothetical protein